VTAITTTATIKRKVTINDWFLEFTLPPKCARDYTNREGRGIAPSSILIYFSNLEKGLGSSVNHVWR
jgi:hypothetical protein